MSYEIGQGLRIFALKTAEALGIGAVLPLVVVEATAVTHISTAVVEPAFAGNGIPNLPVTDSCSPGPGLDVVNHRGGVVHVQFFNQRTSQTSSLILGSGDPGHFNAPVGDTIKTTITEDPSVSDTETVDSCASSTSTSSSTTSTTKVAPSSSTSTTNGTPATTVTTSVVVTTQLPQASTTTTSPVTATPNQGGNIGFTPTGNTSGSESTTTTDQLEPGFTATPGPDGSETASGQAQQGRTIVRTGSDALRNTKVGLAATATGLLALGIALRKRNEDQQPAE